MTFNWLNGMWSTQQQEFSANTFNKFVDQENIFTYLVAVVASSTTNRSD